MSRACRSFPFIPLPYVPYATRSVRRAIASRTTIVIAKAGTSAENHLLVHRAARVAALAEDLLQLVDDRGGLEEAEEGGAERPPQPLVRDGDGEDERVADGGERRAERADDGDVVIGGSYRKAKYAIVESAPNMKSSFHTAQNAMIFGYISFFFMSVP